MEPPRAAPDPPESLVKSNMIHLRKVMLELMETERSYVQDLLTLRNSYVEPIRMEGCLSPDQVEELFGSLTPLTEFQRDFLKALEEGLKVVPDIEKLKDKTQVKRMLFSLGGAFLYYSEHFKLYGAYCANYHKAQRVLEKAKKDGHFQKFLNTLNPSGQHSSTLESFLIKPIQRILKYPLLLRELCSVVDMDSEEGYHLSEALKAMNETASHINEMQKLYEIYGKHFDELMLEHKMDTDEPTDLSMGDLLAHGTVCWLNSARGPTDTHVFVFKKAVVLICKDFLKNRRRSDTIEGSFRYLIPSTEIQMHSSREAVAISGEWEEQWEIIHVSPNRDSHAAVVFQLSSLSSMRMTLERAVRSVLRAQARERLCKASSLPDKPKGYQPFGGTRLSALRTRTSRRGTAAPPSRRLQKQVCEDSEPGSPAYGPLNTAHSTEDDSSSSTDLHPGL
uniref:DH domain-containing protein n=1 Tax=Eptatretus burgeri TaxID=7764 RepID=A0A8C4QXZ2_EPTBU